MKAAALSLALVALLSTATTKVTITEDILLEDDEVHIGEENQQTPEI